MALQPGIILGGQQLDVMGAMSAGLQQAKNQLAFDRQNALQDLYRTQGPQIMAGDQAALNQLAMQDPAQALGFKAQTQSMAWAEEDRAAAKAEGQRMAAEALRANAAKLTAEQLAAEQEAITRGLQGASFFYQNGDRAGYERFLQQNGMDPAQFPFEQFPAHAAMFEGALEAMQSFAPPDPTEGAPNGYMFNDPRNPAAGVSMLPGYEKTPGVVVNTGDTGTPQPQIGSIPQGFAAVVDPTSPAGVRLERIPGGPEDRTASDAAAAAGELQQSGIALQKIAQAREILDRATWYNPATGFGAETAAQYGGTNAADYKAVTDTIEANIAFDALAAMREASPTGGALGAISDRELTLLGATLASLAQAQSPEQARRHLAELEAIYTQIMAKAAAYPNAAEFGFGGGQAPAQPAAPPMGDLSDDDLLRMYGGE